MLKPLGRMESGSKRRIFVKICLNQFEELIRRDLGVKFCNDCKDLVEEKIIMHRLLRCKSLSSLRKTVQNETWFINLKRGQNDSMAATREILKSLETKQGDKIMLFIR